MNIEKPELRSDQSALRVVGSKTDIEKIIELFAEAKKSGKPFMGEIEIFRINPTVEDAEALSILEDKELK
jgi:hypothetical protein